MGSVVKGLTRKVMDTQMRCSMDVIATDSGYDPIAQGGHRKGGRRWQSQKVCPTWVNP